jgi:para-aminobenzoate synthetase / 4-amino-4-deoxychorismate lyase
MPALIPVSSLSTEQVVLRRVALDCPLTLAEVLAVVAGDPWPFALCGAWAGGGAVVGTTPLVIADPASDPFSLLNALPEVKASDAPPGALGGGWFGWLGYRLGGRIESVPEPAVRPVALPDFHLAYYDNLLRLDPEGRWWFEALVSPARERELEARLEHWRTRLARGPGAVAYAAPSPLRLANVARQVHLAAVAACRERIAAGEIFQANICLRLETGWSGSPLSLFAHALSSLQPAYGSAFATPWGGLASLSPELFLRREGDRVITAPIKGTGRRDGESESAAASLHRLRESAKDAAEHVMIVDLMRNDLGRVCAYGTVQADPVPTAEAHPGVWHLVSRVRGRLRAGVQNSELLQATFPPGSVTGAPKVQAMRVIAELEASGREVYTGAIGYASPIAGLELSVAIRTLETRGGRLWLGAGGGIVADSDPYAELEEALSKARPIAAAVGTSLSGEAHPPGAEPAAPPTRPTPPSPRPARPRPPLATPTATATPTAISDPDPDHGVFETLLVRNGRVQALGLHVARLEQAVAQLFGEGIPGDLMLRTSEHARALVGPHRMRLDAVPHDGRVEITISSRPLDVTADPVVLAPMLIQGGLGRYKWRDRRRLYELASPRPTRLILDDGQEILEAAWANVWILEGETVVTPPADDRLLAGVTRALVLDHAEQLRLTAREEPITLPRARLADAIFLTSALRHAVAADLEGEAPDRASAPGRRVVARVREGLSSLAWGEDTAGG